MLSGNREGARPAALPPGFAFAVAADSERARIIEAGLREVAFLRHRIACGRGGAASDAARLAGLLVELREEVAARAAFKAACRKLAGG